MTQTLATVEDFRAVYKPRTGSAVTGWIPMHIFNVLEKDIRPEMRERGMRVIYRGPRTNPASSMTRRADATHAVIYYRSY
jgi:hypothetical protein